MMDLKQALALAVQHIEHMSAWITKANADYHVGVYSFESLGEDFPGIKATLTDETRHSPTEAASHATPQQQLDFLMVEVRKALVVFNQLPLTEYFRRHAEGDHLAVAIEQASDHLASAVNVLAAHKPTPAPRPAPLSDTHRPEQT